MDTIFFTKALFVKNKKNDSVFSLKGTTRCAVLDTNGYYSRDFINYLYGRNSEL